MDAERWARIKSIFYAAVERPADERAAFIRSECNGDETLASEVESLLAAQDRAGSFIEASPNYEATVSLGAEAVGCQPALVGRKISHYEVLSALGAGGMGEVYLAQDTKLSRKVAIKFLPKLLTANEQAKRRFLREARAAATLDHPNICAIHEVGEEDDHSFIVMQYIEGETLADRIRRQPLELSDSLMIAVQVADALSEAQGTAQGVRNPWRFEVDPQTLDWIEGPERLTIGAGLDTDLALSPDGKRLAFTTRTERTRVWSLPFNAQTGRTKGGGQPITPAGMDAWNPKLSRDGKKLVFSAQRAGKQEVWEKSLEDGRETLLIAGDNFGRYGPCWSRDGTRLAYRRYRSANPDIADLGPQAEASMVLLSAGGGEEQLITSPTTLTDTAFDWSSDGEWILGSSDRQTPGRVAICLFPISAAPRAETLMRVVTSHPEYNLWQGHYSPDERWIVFQAIKATEAGVSTIYVIPASGGEWRRITEGKYWDDKPRWSPDGRTIYFVSGRSGFFNVWGMRFDPTGGNPVGEAFRVTAFESPGQMMSLRLVSLIDISLAADRLVLPITEVSGSIWILENVGLF